MRRIYPISLALVLALAIFMALLFAHQIAHLGQHNNLYLNISANYISSVLPGENISIISNKSVVFSGTAEREGYIATADEAFSGKVKDSNASIIIFIIMQDNNDTVSNSTLYNELTLASSNVSHAGSYFKLLKITNYSIGSLNINIPIYTIFDRGVFNTSKVENSQNAGIPLLPYYQYVSMFTYKNYYGSVVVDAYTNASLYSNASIVLAKYMLNYTATKFG